MDTEKKGFLRVLKKQSSDEPTEVTYRPKKE